MIFKNGVKIYKSKLIKARIWYVYQLSTSVEERCPLLMSYVCSQSYFEFSRYIFFRLSLSLNFLLLNMRLLKQCFFLSSIYFSAKVKIVKTTHESKGAKTPCVYKQGYQNIFASDWQSISVGLLWRWHLHFSAARNTLLNGDKTFLSS